MENFCKNIMIFFFYFHSFTVTVVSMGWDANHLFVDYFYPWFIPATPSYHAVKLNPCCSEPLAPLWLWLTRLYGTKYGFITVSEFASYLIQGGLGHRVVFYSQPLPLAGKLSENVGQGSRRVRELILQRVVMLLLQNAAWERLLDKILDWLQQSGRAADPDNHRVAITKPERGKK